MRKPYLHIPDVQGYAWEITTPEGGWGLHGVLQARQHVLNGITNGVDTAEWDPATDAHTPAPFSSNDLRGKADCKAALQKELGFQVNHEVGRCSFIHPALPGLLRVHQRYTSRQNKFLKSFANNAFSCDLRSCMPGKVCSLTASFCGQLGRMVLESVVSCLVNIRLRHCRRRFVQKV
jgi:hypothetical protein